MPGKFYVFRIVFDLAARNDAMRTTNLLALLV
jgi:hypothetical protein